MLPRVMDRKPCPPSAALGVPDAHSLMGASIPVTLTGVCGSLWHLGQGSKGTHKTPTRVLVGRNVLYHPGPLLNRSFLVGVPLQLCPQGQLLPTPMREGAQGTEHMQQLLPTLGHVCVPATSPWAAPLKC
jgi:hypothetical protein